jgi:hypothetical protein
MKLDARRLRCRRADQDVFFGPMIHDFEIGGRRLRSRRRCPRPGLLDGDRGCMLSVRIRCRCNERQLRGRVSEGWT